MPKNAQLQLREMNVRLNTPMFAELYIASSYSGDWIN